MSQHHDTPLLPARLYFETVEQAPVAISITDAKANILYVNRAFEQLTGYDRSEVIGQNEAILSSNVTPKKVYNALWETICHKHSWTGTLVNRTKSGEDYLAELTISPVLDADGEIGFFLAMHRDVSKEHALEVGLDQQRLRIETVLDAAPVIVLLLDAQGQVILENMEYQRLQRELHGHELVALLRAALLQQAGFDPLERALAGNGFKDVEISLDIAGGTGPRWFSCSGVAVNESDTSARSYFIHSNDHGQRLLLLANDITARRREIDRAHLEHLRARLAEQQRAEGLREALTAASYQIQGPLNLIRAATAMFHAGGDITAFAQTLHQISAASEQALLTLHEALPEPLVESDSLVNINELLRHVLEMETDRLLAAGVVVDWQPALILPELSGHKNQLRSLFKYLLDNALLALHESRHTQRDLRLATRALDGAVEVIIEDNGPGIAPDQRLKVFEPFYIGWRNHRGRAGMGLSLAQDIANQHGGLIEVDAETQQGCRIRLILSHAAHHDD